MCVGGQRLHYLHYIYGSPNNIVAINEYLADLLLARIIRINECQQESSVKLNSLNTGKSEIDTYQ
jgi:hypothetical protein